MNPLDQATAPQSTPTASFGERLLSVSGLGVHFGHTRVLHDLSFDVGSGSALAVVGPNGCGKTVLLRALIGALPHQGTIAWSVRAHLGYVPQRFDLDRSLPMTAIDLLNAAARVQKRSSIAATTAFERVGLASRTGRLLIGALSGGQFQRLLIALALIGEPNVLLLDEPTSGIDEPGQERLTDLLDALHRDGVALVMVSHDLSVVSRLATHVLCLTRDHRGFGVSREALSEALLSEVYGEPVRLHPT